MSKICQITGKKAQIGNNVSHSKHRTKRSFDVNLFSKKFYYVEEACWIQLQEVLLRRGGLLDSVEDQRRWSAYD